MLGDNRREQEKQEKIKEIQKAKKIVKPIVASKKASLVKKEMAGKLEPTVGYCRFCCKALPLTKFWTTTNPYIDKNGKMSICSACVQEIMDKYNTAYRDDKTKSVYLTCQDVDIRYDADVVRQTIEYFEKTSDSSLGFMGKYKKSLHAKFNNSGANLRFRDTKIESELENNTQSKPADIEEDRIIEWGAGFTKEEYEYLELKNSRYVQEFGANSIAEKDAFKTLALLYLKQRKDTTNKDIAQAIRNQLTLCGISPEQMKREKNEMGVKSIGMDIALLEQTDPIQFIPQWEKETGRYKDYDGLKDDLRDINRNISNFFGGTRDFSNNNVDISMITGESSDSEDEENV